MARKRVSRATAKRLPLYYRYLRRLYDKNVDKVSSAELSKELQVDSATIRRDFSNFGELGTRGYGYDVENLMRFFERTLSDDELTKVVLVGVGNLGSALLKYQFSQNDSIHIVAAFDNKPEIIGKNIEGTQVFSIDELNDRLREEEVEVAILAVPGEVAQQIVSNLVELGIKAILNFTPYRIVTPEGVIVQSVDLTYELQTLIYFLKRVDFS